VSDFSQLLQVLKAPTRANHVRVLEFEVGTPAQCGAGKISVNPWSRPSDLTWPVTAAYAEEITSCGLTLSLADALENCLPLALQRLLLSYLIAICKESPMACQQLFIYSRGLATVASLEAAASKEARALAAELAKVCRQQLSSLDEQRRTSGSESSWVGWSTSSYELWFRLPEKGVAKVRLQGMQMMKSAFDIGGSHLTGGRLWAGSVLLARWLVSLVASGASGRWPLGDGPILELGAGIGLAGLAAARLGRRVVMSDREPVLLDALQENIRLNGLEEQCRTLPLDWAAVGRPGLSAKLRRQKFSAVVGADLIYEGRSDAELAVGVLRHALPFGGVAFFVNAIRHRKAATSCLGDVLREALYEVQEATSSCAGVLQELLCGEHEPDQEYYFYAARVPPSTADDQL